LSNLIEPVAGRTSVRLPDPRALAQRMSNLKALAREKGYFNVPRWEQALRILELAALPLLAFALLAQGGLWAALGAVVLGLHYPRTAFLGHDLAHNHWGPRDDAKPRFMLRLVALFQGFGSAWWVEKHELHHAFPNACRMSDDGVLTPIDGDIDSAPWVVWDKSLIDYNANASKTTWGKRFATALRRAQVQLLFVFLSVARFNWSWQSVETALRKKLHLEAALCTAHWAVGLALAMLLAPGPAWTGVVWFLSAQLMGGFLLAAVFVLNHTGMEVYEASQAGGFYDRQARSTRNTPSSAFFDWITGGLNSQIEHHMFPTMARRNLRKMRTLTKAAMLECGYAYEELRNREALRATLRALGDAARA